MADASEHSALIPFRLRAFAFISSLIGVETSNGKSIAARLLVDAHISQRRTREREPVCKNNSMTIGKSVSAHPLDTDRDKEFLLHMDKSHATRKLFLFLTICMIYNLVQEETVRQRTPIRHIMNTYIFERYYDSLEGE